MTGTQNNELANRKMADLKGGHLARSAAMLCQDPAFQLYLDRAQSVKGNVENSGRYPHRRRCPGPDHHRMPDQQPGGTGP